MTPQEELDRAVEDRGMLEGDISLIEDDIRLLGMVGVGEDDPEYDALERELNSMQNEVMYLDSVIQDLEYTITENKS